MNIQKALDSIYIIPIVLEHLDNPSPLTTEILCDLQIAPEDLRELAKVRHLLEYHYEIIRNNYHPNYPLLRRGLAEYFECYLSDIWRRLKLANERPTMLLDYGCGDGFYTRQYLKDNHNAEAIMVDRDASGLPFTGPRVQYHAVDFESHPLWFDQYHETFDVVLMAELLHCKNKAGQEYLMRSAFAMLKHKGILVIVENVDYLMEHRIRLLKPDTSVHVVTGYNLLELTRPYKLLPTESYKINRHHVYAYKKV